MAAVLLNEARRQQGLASLNLELRYILEEKRVDGELMGMLGHFGITDNETFAAIASDESSLRAMLKSDFNVDADGGIATRVRAAKMINSWRSSRERIRKQTELDAGARAEGRSKELPRQTQLSLRRAYEVVHGEVEDHIYPSNAYNNFLGSGGGGEALQRDEEEGAHRLEIREEEQVRPLQQTNLRT